MFATSLKVHIPFKARLCMFATPLESTHPFSTSRLVLQTSTRAPRPPLRGGGGRVGRVRSRRGVSWRGGVARGAIRVVRQAGRVGQYSASMDQQAVAAALDRPGQQQCEKNRRNLPLRHCPLRNYGGR